MIPEIEGEGEGYPANLVPANQPEGCEKKIWGWTTFQDVSTLR